MGIFTAKFPAMLSHFQEQKLNHFFNIMDHDKNGQLEQYDFEALAENYSILFGYDPGDEDFEAVRKACLRQWYDLVEFIKPGTDTISKDQWFEFTEKAIMGSNYEMYNDYFTRLTDDLFSGFDSDKDGYISLMEYVDMFVAYGIEVRFSAKSFKKLDRNADEVISREELIAALKEYFFSDDPAAKGNYLFGFMP